ncbi:MAG TPA: hypothetical protein VL098_08405 [Flavipsychrobacter sp.]|nr:hypothetical protein [Flavipsychrobacter sp.]
MAYTHNDYLQDRELTDQHYDGNKMQEEADKKKLFFSPISWSDIETYAKVYPAHEQRAQQEITNRLGYLPHESIVIPHEVFIRTLIEQHDKGLLSTANYTRDLDVHVRHIRNDDMSKFGWADKIRYTWAEIEQYNNYLPQFEAKAHAKFKKQFGEVPAVNHVLPADMMLRKAWSQHPDIITEDFSSLDYKAFTIVAHRKAVIEYGKEAADQLPFELKIN